MQEDPTISSDYIANGSDMRELFFLFEKAPFAMSVLKDRSLIIDMANEKLLEIWGKKKEEVIGEPLLKCFPELIGTQSEKIFKYAFETGEKFVSREYETSFLRNGELYNAYFDLNIDPIIHINGSVTGLLVTSTDVTEQVLARKKAEESQKQLEYFIKQAPVGIVVYRGHDFVVEAANEKVLEMWGKNLDDVKGKAMEDIFPEINSKEKITALYNASVEKFEKGESFIVKEAELTFKRKGEMYTGWYNYTHEPIRDEKGNITGIIAVANEVTDQVLARKKIEESEQQLHLITDAIPSLISYINKDEQYQFNNKGYEQWFGHSAVETKGKTVREIVGDDAYKKISPYIKRVLAGETVSFEAWSPYKDGGKRFISATYIPHRSDENIVLGFYALVNDITQRKKIEQTLVESEEQNRLFIKYAPVAMAMFDKEMRYVSASNQWMKDYDLAGDIIGKKHYELFPNILQRWKDVHSRCMKGAVEKADEDFYVKDDGTPVWLKWEVHPWYKSTDEIGGILIFTENISERKKTEQLIKNSEEQLRQNFQTAPISIWLEDFSVVKHRIDELVRKGIKDFDVYFTEHKGELFEIVNGVVIKDVNDATLSLYEGEKEELLSSLHNFFVEDTHSAFINEIKIIAEGGGRFETETIVRNKKGERLTVYCRIDFPYHDDYSNVQVIILNITEQKKTEKALKESEERFRMLANEAPLFVWLTDEKLQTTYLNKAGLEYFAVDEKTGLPTLSWKKFIHPDDLPRVLEIMNKAAEKHESYTLEMRLRNGKTGEYKWFLDKGAPKYVAGKFKGFVGTSLDIHERKEIEKELEKKVKKRTEQLTEKNRQLIEAQHIAKLGSWVWDMNSNEVKWSDEMYRIYGYAEERFPVTFEKATERMFPEDAERSRQNVEKHIAGALQSFKENGNTEVNNPPIEYRILLPDGSYKILRGMGKIILNSDGKIQKMVGTVQDVTEQLKQMEDLENALRSDKLKSDFIKMASHELKTPVTSIKGFVQLLLSMINEMGEKELSPLMVKSSLVSIERQVNRLTRLMSELLDLSKLETGQFELSLEEHSLNELMIDIVQDVMYTNPKQRINLYHEFECTISCDKDRLIQAVMNLLMNAIKYSPHADKVDVTISRHSDDMANISIQDYGIGIDKKDHEKIFERFYRVQGKTELTYQGFGIGLYIAKEIIQMHGGDIEVKSEKGHGATFTFSIPLSINNKP